MNTTPLFFNQDNFREIIQQISERTGFQPLALEKEYYLTYILTHVPEFLCDQLVLKGSLLLNKACGKYYRLSEDLDLGIFPSAHTYNSRLKKIEPIRARFPEFLKTLGLHSPNPYGKDLFEAKCFVFDVQYFSCFTAKPQLVAVHIVLYEDLFQKPFWVEMKDVYPDWGLKSSRMLSISLNEFAAEKLKAAIARKYLQVRDMYDLWKLSEDGFNFLNEECVHLFKKKLLASRFLGRYPKNFGWSSKSLENIPLKIEESLMPLMRRGEIFEIEKVFERFDIILSDPKYRLGWEYYPFAFFKRLEAAVRRIAKL